MAVFTDYLISQKRTYSLTSTLHKPSDDHQYQSDHYGGTNGLSTSATHSSRGSEPHLKSKHLVYDTARNRPTSIAYVSTASIPSLGSHNSGTHDPLTRDMFLNIHILGHSSPQEPVFAFHLTLGSSHKTQRLLKELGKSLARSTGYFTSTLNIVPSTAIITHADPTALKPILHRQEFYEPSTSPPPDDPEPSTSPNQCGVLHGHGYN